MYNGHKSNYLRVVRIKRAHAFQCLEQAWHKVLKNWELCQREADRDGKRSTKERVPVCIYAYSMATLKRVVKAWVGEGNGFEEVNRRKKGTDVILSTIKI